MHTTSFHLHSASDWVRIVASRLSDESRLSRPSHLQHGDHLRRRSRIAPRAPSEDAVSCYCFSGVEAGLPLSGGAGPVLDKEITLPFASLFPTTLSPQPNLMPSLKSGEARKADERRGLHRPGCNALTAVLRLRCATSFPAASACLTCTASHFGRLALRDHDGKLGGSLNAGEGVKDMLKVSRSVLRQAGNVRAVLLLPGPCLSESRVLTLADHCAV